MALLAREYGRKAWHPRYDPLSELIFTILSQHTSDANSERAFQNLLSTFGSWEGILQAEDEAIARAIWSGGLGRMKAPRIKRVLQTIWEQRGSFDLGFLGDLPLEEAKGWLRGLPGVGPKSVACVLLLALGRPVLPVDTHIYRVTRRLGLVRPKTTTEQAHELLEALLPPEAYYEFHMLFIEHGRRICKAPRPLCEACPLNHDCPSSLLPAGREPNTVVSP